MSPFSYTSPPTIPTGPLWFPVSYSTEKGRGPGAAHSHSYYCSPKNGIIYKVNGSRSSVTASTREDVARHGPFHIPEDVIDYGGWLAPKPFMTGADTKQSLGAIVPLDQKLAAVNSAVYASLRNIGRELYKASGALYSDLKNATDTNWNPEAREFSRFIGDLGLEEIIGLNSISVEPLNGPYARLGLNNGRLSVPRNFLSKVERLIKGYNIGHDGLQSVINCIVYHEMLHMGGIMSEQQVGLLLARFYRNLAAKSHGRKRSIYLALAKENEDYAEMHSNDGKGTSLKRIASLYKKALSKGMSKEEAKKYAEENVQEEENSQKDESAESPGAES